MDGNKSNNLYSMEDSHRDYFLHDFYAQDTSISTVIDLDEYFKYRRNDDQDTKQTSDEFSLFKRNIIFINNIDSFNGKYIAQLLPKLEVEYNTRTSVKAEKGEDTEEERSNSDDNEVSSHNETHIEAMSPEKEDTIEQGEKEPPPKELYQLADLRALEDPFNEYEYMDALYSLYDVGKLTTLEYAELLKFQTDPERLAYLESKFSKLSKSNVVDKGTVTDTDAANGTSTAHDKVRSGETSSLHSELKFIATLKDSSNEPSICALPYVQEVLMKSQSDRKEFKDSLSKCGIFIVDISDNYAEVDEARSILNAIMNCLQNIKEWTPKQFDELENAVTFILVSSLMTWSETPPVDPEEPETPVNEKLFAKRRCHPNYLNHYNFEREVLAAEKRMQGKFNAVIISTGIIYGYEQNTLHYLFKSAWLNGESLPVFGNGTNNVPLIHIDDLAKLIHYLMHNTLKNKFVFGVESATPTLQDITKAVSSALGSGKVKRVPEENAFLIPEIEQEFYDKLTANLNIQSEIVGEDKEIALEFKNPTGFIEAMKANAEIFKICRGLKAIKVIVLGPPGCGKTKVCKALSNYYKINYLSANTAVDFYVKKLQATIKEIEDIREERAKKVVENETAQEEEDELDEDAEEPADDEFDEEEEEELLQSTKMKLAEINESLALNNGQLEEEKLARVVKEVLLSTACQNQGYVLDGFPETLKQAQILFNNLDAEDLDEDEDNEAEKKDDGEQNESSDDGGLELESINESKKRCNKKTIPNEVFCLEASNDFLYHTLLGDPDTQSQELSEKDIFQMISNYRDLNSDNRLLLFFDELEIYPDILSIENDVTPNMCIVTRKLMPLIGKSANYESETMERLLDASKEAQLKQEEEKQHKKQREFKKIKKELIREKLERWASDVDRMKQEEEEILAKESLPVRHYLMKFVLPTLTDGLIEVARVRPNDPIDYLAEHLFKEHPEGRLFLRHQMPNINEGNQLIQMLNDFKIFLDTQPDKYS